MSKIPHYLNTEPEKPFHYRSFAGVLFLLSIIPTLWVNLAGEIGYDASLFKELSAVTFMTLPLTLGFLVFALTRGNDTHPISSPRAVTAGVVVGAASSVPIWMIGYIFLYGWSNFN